MEDFGINARHTKATNGNNFNKTLLTKARVMEWWG